MNHDLSEEERAYASLADELNDPCGHGPADSFIGTDGKRHCLVCLTIDDFDSDVVTLAKKYAEENNLSWPPQVGDFDRYYESVTTRERQGKKCPRCNQGTNFPLCEVCGVDRSDL